MLCARAQPFWKHVRPDLPLYRQMPTLEDAMITLKIGYGAMLHSNKAFQRFIGSPTCGDQTKHWNALLHIIILTFAHLKRADSRIVRARCKFSHGKFDSVLKVKTQRKDFITDGPNDIGAYLL